MQKGTAKQPLNILLVCLGNICRSPTAHGVLLEKINERGLAHNINIDSAGTGGWHAGKPPDERACREARKHGYDLSTLRARQVVADDFDRYDYIFAMDASNLRDLQIMQQRHAADFSGHLGLFLDQVPEWRGREVPDPYYGGQQGFSEVIALVERASDSLLDTLSQQYHWGEKSR